MFYVADVITDKPSHDVFAALSEDTVSLMFPVRLAAGEQRLIGVVPPDLAGKEGIGFKDLRHLPEHNLGMTVKHVNWFSTYHVSHRVAEHFRVGRCFLAGDAGHIHSPVGGQGMNTGIGDAFNLAWKLASVTRGEASRGILDTYEPERIAFARKLVETTDRAFGPLVHRGTWSSVLRTAFLPGALQVLTHLPRLPQMLFRALSQTRITYRNTSMSEGRAGDIRGGDRLPWVESLANFAPLSEFCWQVHIYGAADPALVAVARKSGIKVFEFAYPKDARDAGLACDAAYLIRPDGHVGLALPIQNAPTLSDYLRRHQILQTAPEADCESGFVESSVKQ